MADLELQRKTLKVRIYGQDYDLRKPSLSQVESLIEKQGSEEFKGKDIKLMKAFMSSCGLPAEISSDMDADDFNELATFIIDSSKKKLAKNG